LRCSFLQRLLDAGFEIKAKDRDQAALAEIRELIAEGKFAGEYLIGAINEIAKNGPRYGLRR
jgi:hypothetical protein